MDDDARVLDAFNGGVERLDRPVFVKIRPSEFVELDEIDAERVDFADVLVHRLRNGQSAIARAFVKEIIRALRENLNAGVLYFGRSLRGPLERPRLFDHHGAAPLYFMLDRRRMQPAVNGKTEVTAASKVVTHATKIMINGGVGVIVAMQAAVGDNVQSGALLVERDSADRVLESLAIDRNPVVRDHRENDAQKRRPTIED